MEDFLKKSYNRLPTPASWQSTRPPLMPPLAPPLPPPASFQRWKKFRYGDRSSTGTTISPFQQPPSDGKSVMMIKPSEQGLSDKKLSPTDGGDANEGGVQLPTDRETDQNVDPKKLRRIMSNRISAQKSRIQKIEYVSEMERRIKDLQVEIEIYEPQIEVLKDRNEVLKMENHFLTEQLHAYHLRKIMKEDEIEHNKAEVNRLKKLHMSNQQQKTQAMANGDMLQFVVVGERQVGHANPNHGAGMVANPRGMNRSLNELQLRPPSVYGQQETNNLGEVVQMMSSTNSLSSSFGKKFF